MLQLSLKNRAANFQKLFNQETGFILLGFLMLFNAFIFFIFHDYLLAIIILSIFTFKLRNNFKVLYIIPFRKKLKYSINLFRYKYCRFLMAGHIWRRQLIIFSAKEKKKWRSAGKKCVWHLQTLVFSSIKYSLWTLQIVFRLLKNIIKLFIWLFYKLPVRLARKLANIFIFSVQWPVKTIQFGLKAKISDRRKNHREAEIPLAAGQKVSLGEKQIVLKVKTNAPLLKEKIVKQEIELKKSVGKLNIFLKFKKQLSHFISNLAKLPGKTLHLFFWPLMFVLNFGKKKIKAYRRRQQAEKKEEGEVEVVKPAKKAEEKISPVAAAISLPEKKKETVIPDRRPGKKRSFSLAKLFKFLLRLPFRPLMLVANFAKKKIKAYLRQRRDKENEDEEEIVYPPKMAEEKPAGKELLPVEPPSAAPTILAPTVSQELTAEARPGKEAFPNKLNGIWQVSEMTPPANIENDRMIAPSEFGSGPRPSFRQRTANLLKESLFTLRPSRRAIVVFFIVLCIGVFSFGPLRQTEDKFVSRPQVTEQGTSKPEEGEEGSVLGEKKTNVAESPVVAKIKLTFGQLMGHGLAAIALLFGMFFFVYSIKYYATIVLVLLASQSINQGVKMSRLNNFFHHLFFKDAGYENGNGHNGAVGLLPNFQDEKPLTSYPFVCIQLPFYNEKKVANRILTACTSFDYPNYEVIVIDDSTDETTELLEQWQNHSRVKIIHRENRSGFKGGALREAMKIQDKRTEFVIIFDADFIPYPDTIKQFLKYFLVNGNGNGNGIHSYKDTNIAAVQGYQWHVLNKNENWITRSVRTEFSGSYVIERPGTELMGGLKQIAGSVYMIRSDVLDSYGWTNSITEDFELTMRIYRDGWKVIFTPYIQAPAECVSTIKRLIRQRMRWAEGHTNNIRKYFWSMLKSPYMSRREKAEFLYLAPYYLQSAFLLIGTFCWFVSDVLLHANLPFWTDLWGWSLVFTNLFALPLLNGVGLFFEESEERDYLGTFSFIALCYILAPFQALAALRGLFNQEGGWFRTPKSGHITDLYFRSKYRRWFKTLFPGKKKKGIKDTRPDTQYLKLATSHSTFRDFKVKKRKGAKVIANLFSLFLIILTVLLNAFSTSVPRLNKNISGPENQVEMRSIVGGTGNDNVFKTDVTKQLTQSGVIVPSTPAAKNQTITPTTPTAKEQKQDSTTDQSQKSDQPSTSKPTDQVAPPEKSYIANPDPPQIPEGQDRIEIVGKRNRISNTYYTKENEYVKEITAGSVNYQDDGGQWQEINLNIIPLNQEIDKTSWLPGFLPLIKKVNAQEEKYDFANLTNNFKTYYKSDASEENFLKFEYNGKTISFVLNPLVNEQQPIVKDNQIIYPEILPGIDLRYSVGFDGILEEYIVNTPEALSEVDKLSQNFTAQGVYFEEQENGSIQFFNNEDKSKIWHVPAPVMYELNDQGQRDNNLHYVLNSNGLENEIKKVIGQKGLEWLADSTRKYPLVIDTVVTLNYDDIAVTADDGYVDSEWGVNTTDTTIGMGYDTGTDTSRRGFVEWATTDLATSAIINKVWFNTRVTNTYGTGDTVKIYKLDNTIGEYSAGDLYTDICDATNSLLATVTSFTSTGGKYIDLGSNGVTAMQGNVDASPNTPFVIGLCGSDESTDDTYVASKDHATASYRPSIAVYYDEIVAADKGIALNTERTLFYDSTNDRYWVILNNARNLEAYYSSDTGATWTMSGSTIVYAGSNYYSIWWDQANNKVYLAYTANSFDINVMVGSVGSTTISWGTGRRAIDGTSSNDTYAYPNISKDSSGYCWVSAQYYNGSATPFNLSVAKSDDTACDTADWTGSPTIIDSNVGVSDHGIILPLANQNMYAVFNHGTALQGKLYSNGVGWAGSADSIGTVNSGFPYSSAVVDGSDNIHIVYINSSVDVLYNKRDPSSGWGTAYTVYGTANNLTYPTISLDTATGDVYTICIDTTNSTVYYKKGSSDWSDINDWTPNTSGSATTLDVTSSLAGLSSNYSASGRIFAAYIEANTSDGKGVGFKNIIIPENVWFLIPVIGFLPKLIRKLKLRRSKKSFKL